ncbi:MAG: DUF2062 domain-containing protein [Desulfovibrionaceae bacterium]
MTWWVGFRRLVRFNYLRIIRLKASAHSIALGMALGIFVGFLPIIPFQTVVVLTLALIFRANKITAGTFTFISNPLNLIPFYYMLFVVGRFVLPFEGVAFNPDNLAMKDMIAAGWDFFLVMTAGGVLLGVPSAVVTYFVGRWCVLTYRRRRALRLLRNRD